MDYKRILTVQDISCIGQCSMTVALPILSACGHEACVLPTAVLSSHTGGFQDPSFHSLDKAIPAIVEHWKREQIDFDYIYTGYLGNAREIEYVRMIGAELLAPGGKLIVDPAMADHGRLYRGFDEAYLEEMKVLCADADILIPNVTEAAMLSGLPYRESCDEGYISELVAEMAVSCVVLTGVSSCPGKTGVAVAREGQISYYAHRRIGRSYHGTGDIFASGFVGALAGGRSPEQAAQIGADFVCRCIENTVANPAHWYGVKFETALPELINMLNK